MNRTFSAKTIALCSMMCALGSVVMMLGGVVPVFTYVSPLLASLCLIPIIDLYGRGPAVVTYVSTALLSLLIDADKEAAFFYIFFGYYPLVKDYFDRISPKSLQIITKAMLFFISECAMYFLTCFILGISEIAESFSSVMWINLLFALIMVLTMLLFDFTLNRIVLIYKYKFKDKLFSPFSGSTRK